jgi:hypothetical protein
MYLMYVDESGDIGLVNSPSQYFVLSGLAVHELRWLPYLEQIIEFRRRMRDKYGLHMREEIHAAAMINNPGDMVRIKRYNRLAIIRAFADELASMSDLNVINVVIDKDGKGSDYDVFETAWRALIQRFENTVSRRNFQGPHNPDERGIIIPDNTEGQKLIRLIRKMRRYNPVPSRPEYGGGYRNLQLQTIIEDPWLKDSADSYFIQAADLCAFLLYQRLAPSSYMEKKSGQNYFEKLQPILCTVASSTDPLGIVRL